MRPILVFDSGLGGLTFVAPIRACVPGRPLVYVADRVAFPYGNWSAAALRERLLRLFAALIERHAPALVVLACNTASTLALADLRERFAGTAFVGTVPAIKPAAAATRSGLISVLATPATIRRAYTTRLIEDFASQCRVTRVASAILAQAAETHLRGEALDEAAIAREIAPCFVRAGGQGTDTIVLGCTHYPLLLPVFERLAPWPVTWIDSAPAVARRIAAQLSYQSPAPTRGATRASDRAWLVDEPIDETTARVLARFGFDHSPVRR